MTEFKIILRKTSESEQEFDFIHPQTQNRVRRKIKTDYGTAQRIQKLIEDIGNNDKSEDTLANEITSDPLYKDNADFLLSCCKILFYNYLEPDRYIDNYSETQNYLDSIIPIKDYHSILLLGKAGVGKSTLIKKISPFGDDVDFPFTDTSRTTTFTTEYIFKNQKNDLKFVVAFKSEALIENSVEECIDRAINKKFDMVFNKNADSLVPEEDEVINAFFSDPQNIFDIRLLFGKHIKTTSKNRSLEQNAATVKRWGYIYEQIDMMVSKVLSGTDFTGNPPKTPSGRDFFEERFNELIKSEQDNPIKETYEDLKTYLISEISSIVSNIKMSLIENPSISHDDSSSKDNQGFSCVIKDILSKDFYNFIEVFVSKKVEYFGKSLLPIIAKMRIEIPYNQYISDWIKEKKIMFIDTVGVSHSSDKNGGLENSTNLSLENVDSVIIVDDSRLNLDNNTAIIIKHIFGRIPYNKIYLAYSFFDDFTKAEFDEDDDLYDQKSFYLKQIQRNAIKSIIDDDDLSYPFVTQLDKSNTFFLEKLKRTDIDGFDSTNRLLKTILEELETSDNILYIKKKDKKEPLISYDMKKISLLYQKIYTEYFSMQQNIYAENPPHFKTTEALTRRLKDGITVFYGARVLKPADDFYSCVVNNFNSFIMNPKVINFETKQIENHLEKVLGELKKIITEKIKNKINTLFTNNSIRDTWKILYLYSSSGSDSRRREGILRTLRSTIDSVDDYINSSKPKHLINTLEKVFTDSINELEELVNAEISKV